MIKKIIALITLLVGVSLAQAFAPQAGTWVVASELDGKPGRGMAIDVQNSTLVMQVYAYEGNGQPSFYLAVGTLVNNQITAPLNRHVGGRYFGSGAQSGRLESSPGNVTLRFTSGVSGYVKFPGESEQLIIRANFGYPFLPSSLKGLWSFTSLGSAGLISLAVEMTVNGGSTSNGNGLVMSSNGRFGCEHQTIGSLAGGVLCVLLTTSGTLDKGYYFVYSTNEGEGLMGLGSNPADQHLFVRRLTTPDGVGTGLVFKADEGGQLDSSYLIHQIEALAKASTVR